MSEQEARAAFLHDVMEHGYDNAVMRRAEIAYRAAILAGLPCYYPNTAAPIIPCAGRPRERICITCQARGEKP